MRAASVIVTVALHALAAAALVSIAVSPPVSHAQLEPKPAAPERMQLPRMVFLQRPGPGGGGGGGGNRQPAPPSRASNIGRDRMTLPVARAKRVAPDPVDSPSRAAHRYRCDSPHVGHDVRHGHAGSDTVAPLLAGARIGRRRRHWSWLRDWGRNWPGVRGRLGRRVSAAASTGLGTASPRRRCVRKCGRVTRRMPCSRKIAGHRRARR